MPAGNVSALYGVDAPGRHLLCRATPLVRLFFILFRPRLGGCKRPLTEALTRRNSAVARAAAHVVAGGDNHNAYAKRNNCQGTDKFKHKALQKQVSVVLLISVIHYKHLFEKEKPRGLPPHTPHVSRALYSTGRPRKECAGGRTMRGFRIR